MSIMFIYRMCVLAVIHFSVMTSADVSLSKAPKESCQSTDPDCNLSSDREGHYKLVQLQGIKTGFVQYVTIEGITYKLITRSMRPLLFEIPEFLSEDECDRIVQLAKKEGLAESTTLDVSKDEITNVTKKGDDDYVPDDEQVKQCSDMIAQYDMDKNGQISAQELTSYFDKFSTSALKESDIQTLLLELEFDTNKDGQLSQQECLHVNVSALEEYLDKLEDSHPLYRSRYSQQAWLQVDNNSDPVLVRLQQRILELTKLPHKMIDDSEQLQVVRYSVNGHFHAHYDSSVKRGKPCCMSAEDGDAGETCNLCRFITILYYLNNVTEGGETAFPVADNSTYDEEEYEKNGLSNLSKRCHEANIVVKPVQGTAILWYNHHINPSTGSMGTMDEYSLHGGCDVTKGVKWIANNWLNAPFMHS